MGERQHDSQTVVSGNAEGFCGAILISYFLGKAAALGVLGILVFAWWQDGGRLAILLDQMVFMRSGCKGRSCESMVQRS